MEGCDGKCLHHALPAQPENLRLADNVAVDEGPPDYLPPSGIRALSGFRNGRASPDHGALRASDRASGPLFALVAISDRFYADAGLPLYRTHPEVAPREGHLDRRGHRGARRTDGAERISALLVAHYGRVVSIYRPGPSLSGAGPLRLRKCQLRDPRQRCADHRPRRDPLPRRAPTEVAQLHFVVLYGGADQGPRTRRAEA